MMATTSFTWMGMQMVEEQQSVSYPSDQFEDSPTKRQITSYTYIYRPDGSYEPLAQIKNNDEIFYYQNHINGAPQELVNANGMVLWAEHQGVWGKKQFNVKWSE